MQIEQMSQESLHLEQHRMLVQRTEHRRIQSMPYMNLLSSNHCLYPQIDVSLFAHQSGHRVSQREKRTALGAQMKHS